MFSQSEQRYVSSNALGFFSLTLAARGSASKFVNSAASVGCIFEGLYVADFFVVVARLVCFHLFYHFLVHQYQYF